MPVEFLASRMAIGANVLFLRYYDVMPLLGVFIIGGLSQAMNICVIALLMVFANTQQVSKKCLKSWRVPHLFKSISNKRCTSSQKEKYAYLKRFRKSCKPISLHFGNFHHITPSAVLMYIVTIAKGTTRLLLFI